MIVHLVDGTYELFRHFYGLRRFTKGKDRPYGAVVGVLQTVLQMIENEAAPPTRRRDRSCDRVVSESASGRATRTGAGIERALRAQFEPLEEALVAMGVVVWPMVELEADDALASAAHLAAKERKVAKVAIWTPDKDLAQCVRGSGWCRSMGGAKSSATRLAIREKFGVDPPLIPDLLALVGDAADGYPGVPGIGAKTAATLVESPWSDRRLSGQRSRRSAGAGVAFQKSRDAAHGCTALQKREGAALARGDAGVRGLGGADGGVAIARAL